MDRTRRERRDDAPVDRPAATPTNEADYERGLRPELATRVITRAPATLPDYMSALDLGFVQGQAHRLQRHVRRRSCRRSRRSTPGGRRRDHGAARADDRVGAVPAPARRLRAAQDHQRYYENLGPPAPINSLVEEIADNQAKAHEALKFGNVNHLNASLADITPGGANELAYRATLPVRKAAWHKAIDDMMNNETPDDPSDDFIAILGNVPSGARPDTPQITIPMGYSATTRRALNVSIHGNAYSERDLIGVAYVIEQATKLRQPVRSQPEHVPLREDGAAAAVPRARQLQPRLRHVMKLSASAPALGFSLETESARACRPG